MISGVILQKLNSLDSVLTELRSLGTITVSTLEEDWRTLRAVERDLQVLVEVMIDVCQRILSLQGETPAATARGAVQRCIELGVLTQYEDYERMIQFRNLVVHHYEKIDTEILVAIVNRRLDDFERFRNEVLAYAAGQSGGS